MSSRMKGTANGDIMEPNSYKMEDVSLENGRDETVSSKDGHSPQPVVKDDTADIERAKNGRKTGKEPAERIPFFQLFRFADKLDVLLMLVGTLVMAGLGVLIPINLYYFGELMTQFITYETSQFANSTNISRCLAESAQNATSEQLTSEQLLEIIINSYLAAFIAFGVSGFAAGYIGISLWTWTGERQIRRIRSTYFEAVMRQSVGWFDVHKPGELNTRMVENMQSLSEGFGDKMATCIQWITTFISGYVMSFVVGWKITLVLLTACPLMIFIIGASNRFLMKMVRKELAAYAKAGAVAEETFSAIRTVAAFGGEKKAEEQYGANIEAAHKEGVRKGTIGGSIGGLVSLVLFCACGLTLWYGAKLVREECLDTGAILQSFFGVFMGSTALGYAGPVIENINKARVAAAALFKTIDAHVEIDSSSEEGLKPAQLEGNVEFRNVQFSYPSRQDLKILDNLNLSVKKGQTVALVGESGCGKSTTIQLLQRFYEAAEGSVLIDGQDLKSYNLTWLRNYMGIVSQEPALFDTTIGENIRLGAKWGDEVTQEQIETAAKQANCYDFISKLPKKFETSVGEGGVQLSGGQKQRIAIARALIRNPVILLLDEATSALDTQSEAIVQDALDKASKGRTTIVIAHRLSTVRGADRIFAFQKGQVHEKGTHEELMNMKGIYYSLVMRQVQKEREEAEENEHDLMKVRNNKNLSYAIEDNEDSAQVQLQPNGHTLDRSGSLKQTKRQDSTRSEKISVSDLGNLELHAGEAKTITMEEKERRKDIKRAAKMSMIDLLKMNGPEWHFILGGAIAAMLAGTAHLALVVLLSAFVGALALPDPEEQKAQVAIISGLCALFGLVNAILLAIQSSCFATSGERLTRRLRQQSFAVIVKQEISYFDMEENAIGLLASRVASDASLVKGATGQRVGIIIQSLSTVIAALTVSFFYMWELTLAIMLFAPVMMGAGKFQQNLFKGYSALGKASIEQGGKLAQEAISNMRTVTSLNRQRHFTGKLCEHFKLRYKENIKKCFVNGIAFGVSQSMIFFMYALCFGFGGYLAVCNCLPWRSEPLQFFHILRVFGLVTFGSQAVGRNFGNLADMDRAKFAAYKIKKLLSRVTAIDPTTTEGVIPPKAEGEINFEDVKFCYPTRQAVQVLQGVSFTVNKGETVALVGSSGCGKSTSVSLLERFYDSSSGHLTIDGRDIKSLNVQWLRHQLGLVSQEPTLFDTSIAENIAYGDNTREVPMPEIIQAATKANIHKFIVSLPQGYETNVGNKGVQLSGGQKQRIAIARALVRNPAILLLDEATSALDTESEKVVQEALDEAMRGRTAVVIAHRLSTIRNADKIGVLENGKVVEFGSHEQLLEKKGFYFDLINAQL
ncbi:ATP-dependent translocase ABCB1-like [Watersipora subatra]|uniref:ATP-dependent translocase ABCB1-like n=1 Tax=Watersipora subatra TaxID=2589382 RepID=UPI00355B3353